MIPSAHRRVARVVAAISAVIWIVTSTITPIHTILVPHGRCAEHGEVVELSRDAATDHHPDEGPSAWSHAPSHEDGCSVTPAPAGSLAYTTAVVPPRELMRPMPGVVWLANAPRGPPLAYAPKTSPPSCVS